MISPHLLKVMESFSSNHPDYQDDSMATAIADLLGWDGRPIYVIPTDNKKPKWCHAILAIGPALTEEGSGSELVIIWHSEMEPDTSRVLSAVDWEKYAEDYT